MLPFPTTTKSKEIMEMNSVWAGVEPSSVQTLIDCLLIALMHETPYTGQLYLGSYCLEKRSIPNACETYFVCTENCWSQLQYLSTINPRYIILLRWNHSPFPRRKRTLLLYHYFYLSVDFCCQLQDRVSWQRWETIY